MTPLISARALSHIYSHGTPFEKTALDNVDLDIYKGDFLAVIGHTGSGKSTFVQHLNGLLKPTSGTVLFNGADIFASKKSLREARFKVGLVFQYPEYQLFEETVFRDIAFGPKNMGLLEDEVEQRVYQAARFSGVGEELMRRSPLELSGGQKRRAAIAGVIAMQPELLILDEPTAGLDPMARGRILDNIRAYHDETGGTVMLITHDMEHAARIASRIIVFENAKISMNGTPEEIFTHGEILREMGLAVPGAALIAAELGGLGVKLPGGIHTIEQLVNALCSLRKGGAV
jgi:energy-coupling factor transport system ATP-binding protein